MQRALTWHIDRETGTTRVVLSGSITEDSDFEGLLAAVSTPSIVMDLEQVERINSCGVREWIHFVKALDRRDVAYVLEQCSVAIVNQLNMISNFRGKGQVRSVFAPYFCASCDEQKLRLVEVGSSPPDADAPVPCPACGGAMEFDDLPDQFFQFVAFGCA